MRRVILIAAAGLGLGLGLAGCSSFSLDAFKSTPPNMTVRLESNPPGADAKTSLGPGCKTPCSVAVPAPETSFSVAFSMDKFQPETVQVQVIRNTGAFNTSPPIVFDPNPVVAELQPAPAQSKAGKPHPRKPRAPKTAAAHAVMPADAALPDPNGAMR